jgi:hypothetical protein
MPQDHSVAGRVLTLIVTGSSRLADTGYIRQKLDTVVAHYGNPDVLVLVGERDGIYPAALDWARSRGHLYKPFPLDTARYGDAARHMLNRKLAKQVADLCVAFPLPGSRGTRDCLRWMRKARIPSITCEYALETANPSQEVPV